MMFKNPNERTISSAMHISEENYWLKKLSGDLQYSAFPYDKNRGVSGQLQLESLEFQFPEELNARITRIARDSDSKIFMILVAGWIQLLHKYTSNNDIIVGIPIYKQETQGEFINTVLALRNRVVLHVTFKELLLQTRQTIEAANENANYPIEMLLYQLIMPESASQFPLFDVALLMENIHDERYIRHIPTNVRIVLSRSGESLNGVIKYNPALYERATIKRISHRYQRLMHSALTYTQLPLSELELISEEEKRQILYDFNHTEFDVPTHRTVHGLFEDQVKRIPDHIAAVFKNRWLSYLQLDEKVNALAHTLRARGVRQEIVVGIMANRSLEMFIALIAVLKAGGAYLPLDPGFPKTRINYMLQNSETRILLSQKELQENYNNVFDDFSPGHILWLEDEQTYTITLGNINNINKPGDLIYIIYTSGSTGQPKGVLVEHLGVINMAFFHRRVFGQDQFSRMSQVAPSSFDAMAFEVWPCFLSGASLYIADNDTRIDPAKMKNWLIETEIDISYQPTIMGEHLLREYWPGKGVALKALALAGDKLTAHPTRPYPFRLYNLYGPSEDTVWSTWTEVEMNKENEKFPHIGKPVGNHRVYIVDTNLKPQPTGIVGELCLAGMGMARGYLKMPQLTAEKFIENPFTPGERMYRTSDLARWLPDGNIEFKGRTDSQVKIRGFRVELGEIEYQLAAHAAVKEAAAVVKEKNNGEKQLLAYIVPDTHIQYNNPEQLLDELRQSLEERLPDYMIPPDLVLLEALPLTPSGKVDRKRLPETEFKKNKNFAPPRDQVEEKLAHLWAELLGIEKDIIGLDSSFFELGGHSLTATIMTARIHNAFNVKIPLVEVFEKSRLKEMSTFIKQTLKNKHVPILPTEKKDYYVLSSAQKRMFITQQGERRKALYNIPTVVVLEGNLHREKMETAFSKLIERHESLRTSFIIVDDEPVQVIHPNIQFKPDYQDLTLEAETGTRDREKEEKIINDFTGFFDLGKAPLLRVGLIKTGETRYILKVEMNHIITDGVSREIFVKEFMSFYVGKELPHLRIHYKDFSQWLFLQGQKGEIKRQEGYWLREFEGKIPVLNLPTDFKRPGKWQSFEGDIVSFQLGKEETTALKNLALQENATLYMVLLSLFYILLSKLSGQEDIIIGTGTAGRNHSDLNKIIGMFINTLPLRNFPSREKTFNEFLKEVKQRTLEAFENQDYPFESLVGKVVKKRDMNRHPLFDIIFALQNFETASRDMPIVEITQLKALPYVYKTNISIYDIFLSVIERGEGLVFGFEYKTELYVKDTIERYYEYFEEILAPILENRNIRLKDILISPHLTETKLDASQSDFTDFKF